MATPDSPFSTFLDPTKAGALQPLQPGQPPAGVGSSTLPASFGGPVPAGQTPPPSVNPQVVYTDPSGKGYNPNELQTAWGNGSTAFAQDPANARVRDILPQYGTVLGTSMTAAPTASPTPTGGVTGAGGAQMSGGAFGGPVGLSAGASDPRASAFFDQLMANVNAVPNVGPDDPTIKAQTDAFAAQQERAKRSSLSQMAEKGGDNANLAAENLALTEAAGQNTGAFGASLMSQERQARRAQIQSMLSVGSSYLTAEQSLALQKELNDMNLAERGYEFDTNMAYQTSPFAAGATA